MGANLSSLLLVGLAITLGLYAGKAVRKLGLPSIIGFMILGVVMGASLLSLFPAETVDRLSFVTDIALGFVAFSIGSELSIRTLRKLGRGIGLIIVLESFLALLLVTAIIYALTSDLPLALVFGAMAPATAPAGTVAVIQEYRARGTLTNALYAVAGFDDGIAIILFGFSAAIARHLLIVESTGATRAFSLAEGIGNPLFEIVLSMAVGALLGFVYARLVGKLKSHNDIPALTFGFVALGSGIAIQLHLSLILLNMAIGFVMVNSSPVSVTSAVSSRLRSLMPLLFILFFFLAGAHLDLALLPGMGMIGLAYIFARSAGKIFGARLGATIGRTESKIKNYLGLGLLSQAGVAIGLSLLVMHDFADIAGSHAQMIGKAVVTTITATCIVFEVIGPILARYALRKAGELPEEDRPQDQ